jgi:hypothetical protein
MIDARLPAFSAGGDMVAENFRRIVIGFFAGAVVAFAVATPSVAAAAERRRQLDRLDPEMDQ